MTIKVETGIIHPLGFVDGAVVLPVLVIGKAVLKASQGAFAQTASAL